MKSMDLLNETMKELNITEQKIDKLIYYII